MSYSKCDFDEGVKCPICKEGFTLDDKISSFRFSQVCEYHWYHRACFVKLINDENFICGYCKRDNTISARYELGLDGI
jgi:uncharacterized Zn-finger protein